MTNLNIQTIDSSLVVDSRLVATELGIQHKNLKELIKTYQADFEGFGNLSVSNAGVVGTLGYAEFYYLNEDQCYLLLTFVKNTPEARQAKINLVKAFKGAREKAAQPQLPTDYLTALKALVAVEEEKQQLALEAAQLRPKAESWTRLCDTDGTMSIAAVAKNLAIPGMGPNNLFKFLRDKGFVFYDNQGCNIPKSTLVNDGYLRTVQKYDFKRNRNYSVCVCTFKGYSFIMKHLKKAGYTIPSDSPTTNTAALVA
ncbi:phage regulatory protein/antirepressor Ant [Nostoc sp. UHCC 0252]|uniref:phage regulatory protein/antirepressor Ant n=1 Tax=Nostoc sp. UHCC 0252 TaxID=3110241 RepID=UPI002B215AEE|nr:phage regulatory protein/antirepressor Ant [Nostoc sp. UHCC 0252]MEA5605477.1 phage regulatory protein/antirepressor Ant [Nostoc sp. UHCC 0252]